MIWSNSQSPASRLCQLEKDNWIFMSSSNYLTKSELKDFALMDHFGVYTRLRVMEIIITWFTSTYLHIEDLIILGHPRV